MASAPFTDLKQQISQTRFNNLSDEVIFLIMEKILSHTTMDKPPRNLIRSQWKTFMAFSQVNRRVYRLSWDYRFGKTIHIPQEFDSSFFVFFKNCPCISFFKAGHVTPKQFDDAKRHFPLVRHVSFKNCRIPRTFAFYSSSFSPERNLWENVRSVDFSFSNINDDAFGEFLKLCPRLESINLTSCSGITYRGIKRNLKRLGTSLRKYDKQISLEISKMDFSKPIFDEIAENIGSHLIHLNHSNTGHYTTSQYRILRTPILLENFVAKCPNIVSLSLKNLLIENSQMKLLAQLKNLESLDVSFNEHLTFASLGYLSKESSSLKILQTLHTGISDDQRLEILQNLGMVEKKLPKLPEVLPSMQDILRAAQQPVIPSEEPVSASTSWTSTTSSTSINTEQLTEEISLPLPPTEILPPPIDEMPELPELPDMPELPGIPPIINELDGVTAANPPPPPPIFQMNPQASQIYEDPEIIAQRRLAIEQRRIEAALRREQQIIREQEALERAQIPQTILERAEQMRLARDSNFLTTIENKKIKVESSSDDDDDNQNNQSDENPPGWDDDDDDDW